MSGLTYKVGNSGADFEPVPAGTHFGLCTGVIDVGLQPGSQLYPKPKRVLYLRFEIPAERVKLADGHDAPAIIYERFTASMHKKALLRAALESWRGQSFSDETAATFDVSKVLGAPCTLSVLHNKVGDKTYANVATIGPLPKGMPKPTAENPLILYHAEHVEQFDQVPKFLQEKIRAQLAPETEESRDEKVAAQREDPDDDIPF